jgi:hypothetical protein
MSEETKLKFLEKAKKEPFVPLGVAGTIAMIAYGIHDFKNKGSMSTSVYVMQYRVKAQSMVVGAMALGVSYSVFKEYLRRHELKKQAAEKAASSPSS